MTEATTKAKKPRAKKTEKQERVEFVKGEPHPKVSKHYVREYRDGDEDLATPLNDLENYFHPTGTAVWVDPKNPDKEMIFPYKAVSPGDSTLLNHTALIASVRRMDRRRASKKGGRYTTDDAMAEGELEEYLRDVQNENEYICRVIAMGLTSPTQQMTWEDVPKKLSQACMMFLFNRFVGGAVPAKDSERVERFPSKDEPGENGSEPETPSD